MAVVGRATQYSCSESINGSIGIVETDDSRFQGWVSAPNQRGTVDILLSCASSLFICVWLMLHLNVPAQQDGDIKIFFRRLRWFILCIFAPELSMLVASGQWASAKRSVAAFSSLGHPQWTIVHAFYADAGGFLLQTPDFTPFPLTAMHVHYLVGKGYVSIPTISREEIWDKSKADALAKVIATLQTGWFVIQIIARLAQHISISPMELATLAVLSCTGTSFYFWFYKPLDVAIPTTLICSKTMATIFNDAGDKARQCYRKSPLDFIEPIVTFSDHPPLRQIRKRTSPPMQRIPNDRDPLVPNLQHYVLITVPICAFLGLHLCAWFFHFPTNAERQLWRWSSVAMTFLLFLLGVSEAAASVFGNRDTTFMTNLKGYKLRWPINLLFFVPAAVYCLARLTILGVLFSSLRRLPAGCFDQINWTGFLPHF